MKKRQDLISKESEYFIYHDPLDLCDSIQAFSLRF